MHDLLFLANLISTLTTPWKLAAALLTVLVVMDCLQTIQIAKHREHSIEKNPLINGTWRKWLGRPAPYIHPTVAWVIVYFVVVNAAGFWAMGYVPEALRAYPLSVLAAMAFLQSSEATENEHEQSSTTRRPVATATRRGAGPGC